MNTTESTIQSITPQEQVKRLRLAMIRALSTTADDLRYMQKTIEDLLSQKEHSSKARCALEQRMSQAHDEETLARQEIEALMQRIGN
jgi:predicted  nucleic acid-binding Zn-ribbon protein